MPETPKHRLRATVTYTLELPSGLWSDDARHGADTWAHHLRIGVDTIEDDQSTDRTVKVEVIR